MKNKIFILILLLIFIFFNYPKISFEVNQENTLDCDCFGNKIIENDVYAKCMGLVYDCKLISTKNINNELFFPNDFCSFTPCESIKEYLGFENNINQKPENKVKGINIVIVIDSSGSMQGISLEQTILASEKFIDSLSIFDQVAILTFNDNVELLFEFSNDFQAAKDSLDMILAFNSTRYIPALKLSEKMFENIMSKNDNDNLLIFFSDGKPAENQNQIKEISDRIKKQNIFISSVWFGEDISESVILRDMASYNENQKKAFYTTTNTENLYNSFKNTYENIKKKSYLFKAVSNIANNYFDVDDFIAFDLKLYTQKNDLLIPGLKISDDDLSCISKANVEMIVYDEKQNKKNVPLDLLTNSYVGKIKLDEGKYYLFLNITIKQDPQTDCNIQDLQFFKVIEVVDLEKKETCNHNSQEYYDLFFEQNFLDDYNLKYEYILSTEYYKKRLLFAIDSSQSISQNLLEKEKKALKQIISLLNKEYLIGIIDFNTNADLIVPFTNNLQLLNMGVESIYNKGGTSYYSLFLKLNSLYDSLNIQEYEDYIVIVSDANNWDKENKNQILKLTEKLVEQNICFFPIIYSDFIKSDNTDYKILDEIFELSRINECGELYYVYDKDIFSVFYDVYKFLFGYENELILDTRINKQILSLDEILNIHTRIKSTHNNLEIPFYNQYYLKREFPLDFCVPKANLTLTIIDGKNNTYIKTPVNYYKDYGYYIGISGFEEGLYRLNLDSKLEFGGGILEGSDSFNVQFVNLDNQFNRLILKLIYLMCNFLILLFISYFLYFEFKKFKSKLNLKR
jgi:Mg-chelatase subunit ChlD